MHPSRARRVRMRSRIVESQHNSLGRTGELNDSIDCELRVQLIPFLFPSRRESEPWNRWARPSPLATEPDEVLLRNRRSPRTLMPDRPLRVTQCSHSEVVAEPACDREYRSLRHTNV